MARRKSDTVANVLSSNTLNITFRRAIAGNELDAWVGLVARIEPIQITDLPDTFEWGFHQIGLFLVKSMYSACLANNITITSDDIWKLKLPLKIKIFPWLFLHKGVTLRKGNLVQRNWHGNVNYCFCGNKESLEHPFFSCHFTRFVWRAIELTFGLQKLSNRIHLFGSGLDGWEIKIKRKILVGARAPYVGLYS